MKPGDEVLVFTASGTFRGAKGVVAERSSDGAMIHVYGERAPMLFTTLEIVPLKSRSHMVAGE